MIVELILAWWQGLHNVIVILAWAGVICVPVSIGLRYMNMDIHGKNGPVLVKPMGKAALVTLGLMLLTTIPTPDRLWEVRVALLKLDLSSPENVKAVGGRVDEIVKALECKHLGVNCPKQEKR